MNEGQQMEMMEEGGQRNGINAVEAFLIASRDIPEFHKNNHIPEDDSMTMGMGLIGSGDNGYAYDPLAATPPSLLAMAREEAANDDDGIMEETTNPTMEEEAEDNGKSRRGKGTTKLDELKVQDLKNECKKRHLAVSGSKQQLLDRLRPFQSQILLPQLDILVNRPSAAADQNQIVGPWPPPPPSHHLHSSSSSASSSSSCTSTIPIPIGSSSVIDAVINSVIDGTGMIQGKMAKITGKRAKSKCDWKGKGKGPIGGVNTKQQQQKRGARGKAKANYEEKEASATISGGTLADLLRGGMETMAVGGKELTDGEQKGGKGRGGKGGGARKSLPVGRKQRAQPIGPSPLLMGPSGVVPTPMDTITFSFAQMGSGGQFTPMEPSNMTIEDIPPINIPQMEMERKEPIVGINFMRESTPISYNDDDDAYCIMPSPGAAAVCQLGGGNGHKATTTAAAADGCPICQKELLHNGQSAGAAPSVPKTSLPFHQQKSPPIGKMEEGEGGGVPVQLDELMSARTLAKHEEMLREQQGKIVELQRELGRSQAGLQQHQQMLAEARRATLPKQVESGKLIGQVEYWLNQLEAGQRQMDKANQEQRQMMERQMTGHRTLVNREQKMQEELHTEQAVQDICRLIRQEPKAALLIVQLLRRYQLERNVMATAVTAPTNPSFIVPQFQIAPAQQPIGIGTIHANKLDKGQVDGGQQEGILMQMPRPSAALWNGLLPMANNVAQCQQEMPMEGAKKKKAKGTPKTTRMRGTPPTKTNGSLPRGEQQKRSHSVLDGLIGMEAARIMQTIKCECAALNRRPNSSLGGMEGGNRNGGCIAPVDMEEIFRSVLQPNGATDTNRMPTMAMMGTMGQMGTGTMGTATTQKSDSHHFHSPPYHQLCCHLPPPLPPPPPMHSFLLPIPDSSFNTGQMVPSSSSPFIDSTSSPSSSTISIHHQCHSSPFLLDSVEQQQQQLHNSQEMEMEKTMQDLMEVLRDDQRKAVPSSCGKMEGANYRTDQLATFLAEEVELCRSGCPTGGGGGEGTTTATSTSATFLAQAQSMAAATGNIRLFGDNHHQHPSPSQQTAFNSTEVMAKTDEWPTQIGGETSPPIGTTELLLFQCPEEAEKAIDWLDGFDPFTAVF